MSTKLERAHRAERCLDYYRDLAGDLSVGEAVTDLVANIGHFCVEHDLTYLYLLARGISHWRLEMTDPDGIVPPEVTITIHESTDHA